MIAAGIHKLKQVIADLLIPYNEVYLFCSENPKELYETILTDMLMNYNDGSLNRNGVELTITYKFMKFYFKSPNDLKVLKALDLDLFLYDDPAIIRTKEFQENVRPLLLSRTGKAYQFQNENTKKTAPKKRQKRSRTS